MPLIRQLLMRAARQVASDPEMRAKAAELFRREVQPRASDALRRGRPVIDAARDELRETAREADPRRDPVGFLRRLAQRHNERGEG